MTLTPTVEDPTCDPTLFKGPSLQSHEAELEAMYIAKLYRGVFAEPDIRYINQSRRHVAHPQRALTRVAA
jgi:hypothetical protein